MNFPYFILVLFVVTACHTHQQEGARRKEAAFTTTNNQIGAKVFDSSLSVRNNLEQGWIDTFFLQGAAFRLRHDSTDPYNPDVVEVNQNGKWQKNLSFPTGDEYGREDLNGDGYEDLTSSYQNQLYVSYYSPEVRRFDTTVWTLPGDSDEVLDSSKKLHYNWQDVYHGCDHPHSQLYTYKDGKPYFYYLLDYERPCEGDVKSIKLYRFERGDYTKFHYVKTVTTSQPTKFDYRAYWRKNYQILLGNR